MVRNSRRQLINTKWYVIVSSDQIKPARGRPKTLDRAHALDAAIQSYWAEGVDGVSLNEICRRASVSKPALYREFKSEDGLMKAALVRYSDRALAPMHQALSADIPFTDALDELIAFATADHTKVGNPVGCMFVDMCGGRAKIGEATRDQLDNLKSELLGVYEGWVDRAKGKGEFPSTISTQFAAVYIEAQLSNAMSQQSRGENNETIREVLEMAFSVFE